MSYLANITRAEGDPKIISTGPSSLLQVDRLGRALGWFSLALGVVELAAPRRLARMLGMRGYEPLIRAYGARELAAGVMALSADREAALWGRVAGDALDLATLGTACRSDNPKRGNVGWAIGIVLAVTALDIMAAQCTTQRHTRVGATRDYSDRSGFPRGTRPAAGGATSSGNA